METEIPANVDEVVLPVSLIFKPVGNLLELDTYNVSQFKRDGNGKVYFDGKPTTIKVGDIVTVTKKQDNIDGKNYWLTEGGLMIPKEAGLFKITDATQTVSDAPPIPTPPVVEDKGNGVDWIGKPFLVLGGVVVGSALSIGYVAYKIASCSNSKYSKLIGVIAAIGGGFAGYTVHNKFVLKKD